MGNLPTFWRLENFIERLDAWIAVENPSEYVRIIVTEWVVTRFDNPYKDVSRQPDFPNLWFGPIPATSWRPSTQVTSWSARTGLSRKIGLSGAIRSRHSDGRPSTECPQNRSCIASGSVRRQRIERPRTERGRSAYHRVHRTDPSGDRAVGGQWPNSPRTSSLWRPICG